MPFNIYVYVIIIFRVRNCHYLSYFLKNFLMSLKCTLTVVLLQPRTTVLGYLTALFSSVILVHTFLPFVVCLYFLPLIISIMMVIYLYVFLHESFPWDLLNWSLSFLLCAMFGKMLAFSVFQNNAFSLPFIHHPILKKYVWASTTAQ